MLKTPEECLEQVHDRQTFVLFLEALAEDWEAEREIEAIRPSSPYGRGALGWENGTIGAFLEAAAACARGGLETLANPWRDAAEILLAGKYYE